jgi:hypothetical protein
LDGLAFSIGTRLLKAGDRTNEHALESDGPQEAAQFASAETKRCQLFADQVAVR